MILKTNDISKINNNLKSCLFYLKNKTCRCDFTMNKRKSSAENNTCWSADGSYIPRIEAHTKVKHKVLEAYIQKWVETLLGHGKYGVKKLTIIDGYAGGGAYQEGTEVWAGSPLRIIQSFEKSFHEVYSRKPYLSTDFKFIFIDSKIDHIKCLELQLREAGCGKYIDDGRCELRCLDFEESLEEIVSEVNERKGNSFFFLDPFDLDVTPEITRKIFHLSKTEVLLNHMVSGLYRILGNRSGKYNNFFEKYGYDSSFQESVLSKEALAKYSFIRNETGNLFRKEGGGTYYHTFALIDEKTAPIYYLLHLSNSPAALRVMKLVTWEFNNLHFQYQYDIHGFGQITKEEYTQNLTIIDVNDENNQFCVNKLSEQICESIESGTKRDYLSLYHGTFQENPGTEEHYNQAIVQLQNDKDIVVIRKGKIVPVRKLKSDDLISRVEKQLIFFNKQEFRNTVQVKGQKPSRQSNKKKDTLNVTSIQLSIDEIQS
jgi:three-Cys-motif partner protein